MGVIHINKLRLRTLIGFQPWELEKKQEVVIDLKLELDDAKAQRSDDLADCFNYKTLTKAIIEEVEGAQTHLIEALAARVMRLALNNPQVTQVWVRVEKPHALRYTDGVAYEISSTK